MALLCGICWEREAKTLEVVKIDLEAGTVTRKPMCAPCAEEEKRRMRGFWRSGDATETHRDLQLTDLSALFEQCEDEKGAKND